MIYSRFKIFGEQSADAYVGVLQSILYKLEDRLEEEWDILSSVVNIKNIMTEKISNSDYTALWLVYNHIVKVNKLDLNRLQEDMQCLNQYRDKLMTFIFEFYNEIFRRKSNESYINSLAVLFRGDEQQAFEQQAVQFMEDQPAENDLADGQEIDDQDVVVQVHAEEVQVEVQVPEQNIAAPAVEANIRPRRQRKPPNRLNICSTKTKTY